MKYARILVSIPLIVLTITSCSVQITQQDSEEAETLTSVQESGSEPAADIDFQLEPSIVAVTREAAGLNEPNSIVDIDTTRIHPEIAEAIDIQLKMGAYDFFPGNYYERGIEMGPFAGERFVIVSMRWKDAVIDDLQMGGSQDKLLEALGEPSSYHKNENNGEWIWFYITKEYYIGFSGLSDSNKFDYVIFKKLALPLNDADADILYSILQDMLAEQMNFDNYPLFLGSKVGSDPVAVTTQTEHGLDIVDYADRIEVYQSFPGNLYQLVPENDKQRSIQVVFINYDPIIEDLSSFVSRQRQIHDTQRYTHTTSDGRFSFDFDWIGESHFSAFNVVPSYSVLLIYDHWGLSNPYFIFVKCRQCGWLEDTYKIWGYEMNVFSRFTESAFIIEITDDGYIREIVEDTSVFPEMDKYAPI